jgi:DNA invertase Pin-like site-specific DNA recombinase
MRCHTILYARKSSEEDDRQALSLDAQERECREYAGRHGIAIDEVVREAHSAKRPGRPLFNAMIRRCEDLRSNHVQVRVISHKPDRLLRNIADWARTDDLMDGGTEFVFVTGSYPNNAQGKMAFGINVVFAKYYVDNLSEEVRKGYRAKIARGEWPHSAPLGYLNRDRRIVLDPARAPLVRMAFERFATGEYSLDRLAVELHREGLGGRRLGKKLSKNVLATHLLSNPFYIGLMRAGGQLHPGSHPPLVSTAVFDRVQELLHSASRPRKIRREFRYSGTLACGACGGAVIGDVKKGRYVYYRCSHRQGHCGERYVREEALEAMLRETVAERLQLPAWVADGLQEAAERLREESSRETDKAALAERLAAVERKLEALLDLRLAGHVGDDEYRTKREQLLLERERTRERLAAFELPVPNYGDLVERFVRACNGLHEILPRLEDGEARQLLRLVGSNYLLKGKKIDFEPVEPFATVTQIRNRSVWRPGEDVVRTFVVALGTYDALRRIAW